MPASPLLKSILYPTLPTLHLGMAMLHFRLCDHRSKAGEEGSLLWWRPPAKREEPLFSDSCSLPHRYPHMLLPLLGFLGVSEVTLPSHMAPQVPDLGSWTSGSSHLVPMLLPPPTCSHSRSTPALTLTCVCDLGSAVAPLSCFLHLESGRRNPPACQHLLWNRCHLTVITDFPSLL